MSVITVEHEGLEAPKVISAVALSLQESVYGAFARPGVTGLTLADDEEGDG